MDEELLHYGVKGMKWGIRRTPAQLGYKPRSTRKKAKAKEDTSKQTAKKLASGIDKGKNFVKNNWKTAAKAIAIGVAGGLGAQAFADISGAFDSPTLHTSVAEMTNEYAKAKSSVPHYRVVEVRHY